VEARTATPDEVPGEDVRGDKGLKKDSIGFVDGLAIGLDSTAPAYSLAAVIGSIVVIAGVYAPAILLVSFIPMFFIAGAFYYLNKVDQDCGTTFSWVTRTMGPWAGWIGGWAIFTTGILVVGSLADVAAYYIFDLFSLDSLRDSRTAVITFAVVIIVVMTAICVIGTELSAKVQRVLALAQVGALLLFIVVAAFELIFGDAGPKSIDPSLSWLNPFAAGSFEDVIVPGALLGVFIYWGWESAVNLTEESEDSARAPGLAGIVSTVTLLGTYIGVAYCLIAYAGLGKIERFDDDAGVLGAVAEDVLGPLSFLVVISIIVSGIASTQTTILPASRTSLSMAVAKAFPHRFAAIHPRYLTPAFGTILIGVVATVWYVGASAVSDNFLFDSLSALSLMIAFYYALTGVACAIYYRHELLRSVKNALFIGVAPVLGAAMLTYLLYKSIEQLAAPEDSYSGTAVLGVGVPLAIAVFFTLVGIVLMFAWRFTGGQEFFRRRAFEAVPRDVVDGDATVAAIGMTDAQVDEAESREGT